MSYAMSKEVAQSSDSAFSWKIKKYSKLCKKTIYLEFFNFLGYRWKFAICPTGSNDFRFSLYPMDSPSNLNELGEFKLGVINQTDKNLSVWRDGRKLVWYPYYGWHFAFEIRSGGFIVEDTCCFEVVFLGKQNIYDANVKQEVETEENEDTPCKETLKDSRGKETCNEIDERNFISLFEEIARVIGDASVVHPNSDISRSLSLLNEVSNLSFSQITSNLRDDLISALETLLSDNTLPSFQALAIHDFSKQFGDLFESYKSSVGSLNAFQQYLDDKESLLVSLRRLHESQTEIMKSVRSFREEKVALMKRCREVEEKESESLKEYNVIGREAKVAKTGWDKLVAKSDAMVEQRNKVKYDMANAETLWNTFISNFK